MYSIFIVQIIKQLQQAMLGASLQKYEEIPVMSESQLKSAMNGNKKLICMDELIVDVTSFEHPGTNCVLQGYINKADRNIAPAFINQSHSLNAKLMLINLAVGRKYENQGQGYQVYKQVKEWKIANIHEKMLGEIDLKQPLLKQLAMRDAEELQALVTIPKYFDNAGAIIFKETKWQDWLYRERFWVSTSIFTIVLILAAHYLYINSALLNDLQKIILFMGGILMWTAIEYYFHRIVLHVPFAKGMYLPSHYIHHAFPNIRDKLSLSIFKNLTIQSVFYMVTTKIGLNHYNILNLLLGLHFFMILYDVLHYYFHFGSDLPLPFLNKLKKNHMKHHYRDQNRGFGVTTTLWDWVFGTAHIK